MLYVYVNQYETVYVNQNSKTGRGLFICVLVFYKKEKSIYAFDISQNHLEISLEIVLSTNIIWG